MRALIVAAVSTTTQADAERDSIPSQLRLCRDVCAARGWPVAGEIVIPGHSRNYAWLHEIVRDSPDYARLVDAIAGHTMDLIVVRDYDRLWRTDALRAQLMALAREHRVQVYSANQPVEPVDPRHLIEASDTTRIMEALSGVLSEQENRTRTRRMMMGRRARVERRGLPIKGRFLWYGYRRDPETYIAVDPEQAVWVRWIYERCAHDRWGPVRIAEELERQRVPRPTTHAKRWHTGVVGRILSNPLYKGTLVWGDVVNEHSQVPAIVSEELWETVQAVREHRAGSRGRQHTYALTGLVRCAQCGYAMSYACYTDKRRNQRYAYLRCSHYVSTRGHECASNYTACDVVEAAVLAQVQAVLSDDDAWRAARGEDSGHAERIAELSAAIAELDARWARWNHAHEIGAIGLDEMLVHRQRILGERDTLKAQIDRLTANTALDRAASDARELMMALLPELPALPPDELNQVYNHLIKEIRVAPGKPEPTVDIVFL